MAAQPPANASGALTLDGVATPLRYAYATAEPGAFDKTTEDIRIVLSDVPIEPAARGDIFALSRLGRRDEAHIVEVTLNAAGDPIAGAIYASAFNGMLSLTGMHRFERERFDHAAVAGVLHTRAAGQMAGVTYEYYATFIADIPRPPTAAQVAASLVSPPGLVAARHLETLKRGDVAAFTSTLTGEHRAHYAGAEGAARFAALRREMPPDARLLLVETTGATTATATVQGRARGIAIEYLLPLVRDPDGWKVSR